LHVAFVFTFLHKRDTTKDTHENNANDANTTSAVVRMKKAVMGRNGQIVTCKLKNSFKKVLLKFVKIKRRHITNRP